MRVPLALLLRSFVLLHTMFLGFSDGAAVSVVNENDLKVRPMGVCGILLLPPTGYPGHRSQDSSGGSEFWGQASAYLFWSISSDGSRSGRENPVKGWIHAFRPEGPLTVLLVYFPLPASPRSFHSLMLTSYHVALGIRRRRSEWPFLSPGPPLRSPGSRVSIATRSIFSSRLE